MLIDSCREMMSPYFRFQLSCAFAFETNGSFRRQGLRPRIRGVVVCGLNAKSGFCMKWQSVNIPVGP
jgi:hypothetical protein